MIRKYFTRRSILSCVFSAMEAAMRLRYSGERVGDPGGLAEFCLLGGKTVWHELLQKSIPPRKRWLPFPFRVTPAYKTHST